MVVSAAFVSGVVVGGVLTALAGWRSVFVVNPVLGMTAAVAARALLMNDDVRSRIGDLDIPGALAAIGAVVALLYGLGLAGRNGALSLETSVLLGLSILLAGLAWELERRARVPLLPDRLLRMSTIGTAFAAALLTVGTGVGVVFVLTLYLQDVLGYGPIASGLALTLLGVAGVAAGWIAPRVARTIGLPRALAAALVVQAIGVAILLPIGADRGLPFVLAGTAVLGAGHFGATVLFTARPRAAWMSASTGSRWGSSTPPSRSELLWDSRCSWPWPRRGRPPSSAAPHPAPGRWSKDSAGPWRWAWDCRCSPRSSCWRSAVRDLTSSGTACSACRVLGSDPGARDAAGPDAQAGELADRLGLRDANLDHRASPVRAGELAKSDALALGREALVLVGAIPRPCSARRRWRPWARSR